MMSDKMDKDQPKQDYLIEDESKNVEAPILTENDDYKPADKLKGKVALITGADSGIGQAVAIAFAKEGAKVAFVDIADKEDAKHTQKRVEELGSDVLFFQGDVGDEEVAKHVVKEVVNKWGQIDILVNNAAERHTQESIKGITVDSLDRTFRTNIFSFFYFVKAALDHLSEGAAIINTSSDTAYEGAPDGMDYAATNGAIVSFTRSLAQNEEILDKKIRVNSVSPGPIWTPFVPAVEPGVTKESFGEGSPLERPGEAYELAPAYVYLASEDSSYVTGQVLHVNGGGVVTT